MLRFNSGCDTIKTAIALRYDSPKLTQTSRRRYFLSFTKQNRYVGIRLHAYNKVILNFSIRYATPTAGSVFDSYSFPVEHHDGI